MKLKEKHIKYFTIKYIWVYKFTVLSQYDFNSMPLYDICMCLSEYEMQ